MPKVLPSAPTPGGGRLTRGRRVSATLAEINVIPLVDVMLVLLIIFMVAAPMLQRGVEVNLPWHYQTVDEFSDELSAQGFRIVSVELVPRPTLLPSGMKAWLRTFAGPAFEQLPETEREPALAEAVELLRGALCDTRGNWTADYTRLRFWAERPT